MCDIYTRLEQEKLAHKLERANSPTQDLGAVYDMDPQDAQYSDTDGEPDPPVPAFDPQKQVQYGHVLVILIYMYQGYVVALGVSCP